MNEGLTSGNVVEIIAPTGVTGRQFQNWCERKQHQPALIVAADGGGSQGEHRRFTLMQAVGIAVAAKVYKSERGCADSYVGMIVKAFGALTEEKLVKMFGPHRQTGKLTTHLMMVHGWGDGENSGASIVLDAPTDDRIDVSQTYSEVKKAIATLAKQKPDGAGRRRGLFAS